MTIYRVNPSNWATGSRVTKSQVTLLDKDISYGIDKKQGNTDIVSSGITVAAGGGGNGGATFQSGSSIDIQDPAIIEIDDGNMAIDCQIIGDKQPIRHGYIKMIGNGSGSYSILPSAYYQHNHFKLTGTLTGVFEITIPNTTGVEKFFEGAFSAGEASDGYVKLTTGGTDTVVIEAGTNHCVYTNTNGVYEVARSNYLRLIDEIAISSITPNAISGPPNQNAPALSPHLYQTSWVGNGGTDAVISGVTPTLSYGDIGLDNLGFTDLTTPGKLVFLDSKAGDIFEIFLSCGVQKAVGSSNTLSWISPFVRYGDGYIYRSNKYSAPLNEQTHIISDIMIPAVGANYNYGSGRTVFTAPYDGTYEFSAYMYYELPSAFNFFPVVGLQPLTYLVKQYRGI